MPVLSQQLLPPSLVLTFLFPWSFVAGTHFELTFVFGARNCRLHFIFLLLDI